MATSEKEHGDLGQKAEDSANTTEIADTIPQHGQKPIDENEAPKDDSDEIKAVIVDCLDKVESPNNESQDQEREPEAEKVVAEDQTVDAQVGEPIEEKELPIHESIPEVVEPSNSEEPTVEQIVEPSNSEEPTVEQIGESIEEKEISIHESTPEIVVVNVDGQVVEQVVEKVADSQLEEKAVVEQVVESNPEIITEQVDEQAGDSQLKEEEPANSDVVEPIQEQVGVVEPTSSHVVEPAHSDFVEPIQEQVDVVEPANESKGSEKDPWQSESEDEKNPSSSSDVAKPVAVLDSIAETENKSSVEKDPWQSDSDDEEEKSALQTVPTTSAPNPPPKKYEDVAKEEEQFRRRQDNEWNAQSCADESSHDLAPTANRRPAPQQQSKRSTLYGADLSSETSNALIGQPQSTRSNAGYSNNREVGRESNNSASNNTSNRQNGTYTNGSTNGQHQPPPYHKENNYSSNHRQFQNWNKNTSSSQQSSYQNGNNRGSTNNYSSNNYNNQQNYSRPEASNASNSTGQLAIRNDSSLAPKNHHSAVRMCEDRDWQTLKFPNRSDNAAAALKAYLPRSKPRYADVTVGLKSNTMRNIQYIICYCNDVTAVGMIKNKNEIQDGPLTMQFGYWNSPDGQKLCVGSTVIVSEYANLMNHGKAKPYAVGKQAKEKEFFNDGYIYSNVIACRWAIVSKPEISSSLGMIKGFGFERDLDGGVRYSGQVFDQEYGGVNMEVPDDLWSYDITENPRLTTATVLVWADVQDPHTNYEKGNGLPHLLPSYAEEYFGLGKLHETGYWIVSVTTRYPNEDT
ncbi:hypothetical protein M3Y97_00464000 [Aphelenchoides bicaudatus]|nr:hypothetical protein M3Y97_00464000 [Aphelenchoides bicaudatus]